MSSFSAIEAERSIGVVIVNWNSWRDTLEAYRSLAASHYRCWTLVVIDNASTDGSADKIAAGIPTCILIRSATNLGFSGGCNLGIAKVVELGLDYIFLLNPDATVDSDALGYLVAASHELNDSAVLGCVVRYAASGELQFFGSRWSKGRGRPEWYAPPQDVDLLRAKLIPSDLVFGAAFFAPTAMFQKVGMFDERFFLNYEETDWCYRAAALGVPLFIVSDALVHHQASASLGDIDGPLQAYFIHRNRLLFYDKHAGLPHRLRGYAELARYIAVHFWQGFNVSSDFRIAVDPSSRAAAMALRDYVLRRFGDCPPKIRELAEQYRCVPAFAEAE